MRNKESLSKEQEDVLRSTLIRYKIAKELRKRRKGSKQDNRITEEYIS